LSLMNIISVRVYSCRLDLTLFPLISLKYHVLKFTKIFVKIDFLLISSIHYNLNKFDYFDYE